MGNRLLLVLFVASQGFAQDAAAVRDAVVRDHDPVRRHLSSLLLGVSRRAGSVSVFPLYARAPGETPGSAAWLHRSNAVRAVHERGRAYLRIANQGVRPVFVPAGAVFTGADAELALLDDVVVSAEFSALAVARRNPNAASGSAGGPRVFRGMLPPHAVARLLLTRAKPQATPSWRPSLHAKRYMTARRRPAVRALHLLLEQNCHALATARNRTAVGAVFVVDGRPVAVHVFRSHDLFVEGLSDLLGSVATQARLPRTGRRGLSERARVVAFLRAALEVSWSGRAPGGHVTLHDRQRAFVGHAALDARGGLVHFGLYAIHDAGAERDRQASTQEGPPVTPGEVGRKPRPSLTDLRQYTRKPHGSGS